MQGFLNVLNLKTPFLEDYFGTDIPLANGAVHISSST